MKKTLVVFLAVISLFFCACSNNPNEKEDNDQYIELTLDNCNYYLSIQQTLVEKKTLANKTFYTYEVVVQGAIDGIYQDCVIAFFSSQ